MSRPLNNASNPFFEVSYLLFDTSSPLNDISTYIYIAATPDTIPYHVPHSVLLPTHLVVSPACPVESAHDCHAHLTHAPSGPPTPPPCPPRLTYIPLSAISIEVTNIPDFKHALTLASSSTLHAISSPSFTPPPNIMTFRMMTLSFSVHSCVLSSTLTSVPDETTSPAHHWLYILHLKAYLDVQSTAQSHATTFAPKC
ncbi:hypothetical protein BU17DRAFT_90205 [Hysterangium stoloniferum]|nr:hypothetical protein BU17DRAFT_90205 [Hysterangium stoloniferum]